LAFGTGIFKPGIQGTIVKVGKIKEASLWQESITELGNPMLIWQLVIFSGFCFMLNAFWDLGPLHFRNWVDASVLVRDLFGSDGTSNPIAIFAMGMAQDGKSINPEGLVNLNAFMIMTICFLMAGFSARLRATNSMALGTFLAAAAMLLLGGFNFAWVMVIAIMIFSMGEMLSSPKSSEYLGNIAPSQKKAMYLGFSQLPIGIGWIAESFVGPALYGAFSSKENLSREVPTASGIDVSVIPIGGSLPAPFNEFRAERGSRHRTTLCEQ
jgi:hypothetical protein